MDTALHISGDNDTDQNGLPYRIDGYDEIRQQLYILLSARKGCYLYDRQLGSDIFTVDTSQSDCIPLIEAKARNALTAFPDAEIVGVVIDNRKICVSVQLDSQLYEITLR